MTQSSPRPSDRETADEALADFTAWQDRHPWTVGMDIADAAEAYADWHAALQSARRAAIEEVVQVVDTHLTVIRSKQPPDDTMRWVKQNLLHSMTSLREQVRSLAAPEKP